MAPTVLHPANRLLSLRHAPSFMLLAFAAGGVNAAAFLACQRFVSHVTGTVTRTGLDASVLTLALESALAVACFVAGAMASVFAIDGRAHRGKKPLHGAPLVAVAGLLALVAVVGSRGAFGPFGAALEEPAGLLPVILLSFAMGLQNATVATSTGLAVRTTHMTGPASDLGVHLGTSLFAKGDARQAALRGAALRGGKLLSFFAGAALAVPLAGRVGYLSFLAPAAFVLLATALSFAPARAPGAMPAPAV